MSEFDHNHFPQEEPNGSLTESIPDEPLEKSDVKALDLPEELKTCSLSERLCAQLKAQFVPARREVASQEVPVGEEMPDTTLAAAEEAMDDTSATTAEKVNYVNQETMDNEEQTSSDELRVFELDNKVATKQPLDVDDLEFLWELRRPLNLEPGSDADLAVRQLRLLNHNFDDLLARGVDGALLSARTEFSSYRHWKQVLREGASSDKLLQALVDNHASFDRDLLLFFVRWFAKPSLIIEQWRQAATPDLSAEELKQTLMEVGTPPATVDKLMAASQRMDEEMTEQTSSEDITLSSENARPSEPDPEVAEILEPPSNIELYSQRVLHQVDQLINLIHTRKETFLKQHPEAAKWDPVALEEAAVGTVGGHPLTEIVDELMRRYYASVESEATAAAVMSVENTRQSDFVFLEKDQSKFPVQFSKTEGPKHYRETNIRSIEEELERIAIQDRLGKVEFVLETILGLSKDQYSVVSSRHSPDATGREGDYWVFDIPNINAAYPHDTAPEGRVVLVYDQIGSATYVFDREKITGDQGLGSDDASEIAVLTKNNINNLINNDHDFGQRIIYHNDEFYQEELISAVVRPHTPDGKYLPDRTVDGYPPATPENGVQSASGLAYKWGAGYNTIQSIANELIAEGLIEEIWYAFGTTRARGFDKHDQTLIYKRLVVRRQHYRRYRTEAPVDAA